MIVAFPGHTHLFVGGLFFEMKLSFFHKVDNSLNRPVYSFVCKCGSDIFHTKQIEVIHVQIMIL